VRGHAHDFVFDTKLLALEFLDVEFVREGAAVFGRYGLFEFGVFILQRFDMIPTCHELTPVE
jgi:hypothetical protein